MHGGHRLFQERAARSNGWIHLVFKNTQLEAEYRVSRGLDVTRLMLSLELAAVVITGVLACLEFMDHPNIVRAFFRINNLVTIILMEISRRILRCRQSRQYSFVFYIMLMHWLVYQSLTQTRARHLVEFCSIDPGSSEGGSDDEAYGIMWCVCGIIAYYFVFTDVSMFFSVIVILMGPLVWLLGVLLIFTTYGTKQIMGTCFTYLLVCGTVFAGSRKLEMQSRISFLQSRELASEIGKMRTWQKGLQRILAMNFDASDVVGLDLAIGETSPLRAILGGSERDGKDRLQLFGHGPEEQQRLQSYFAGLQEVILEDPGVFHGPDRLTAALTVDDLPIDFEVESIWMPFDNPDEGAPASQPLGVLWIGLRRNQGPDTNAREQEQENWEDLGTRAAPADFSDDGASRSHRGGDGSAATVEESLPNTTVTGNVFVELQKLKHSEALKNSGDGCKQELQERLRKVVEIGEAEGWLFGTMDLQLVPEKVLGVGGYGVVVTAKLHGSDVAVKLPKCAEDRGSIRLMISMANELRILRKVRHPRIVAFHGACIDAASCELCLVSELVQGTQMDKFVRPPPMPPGAARRHTLVYDIACALRYLHAQDPPIIHGDLKPANVMVERMVNGLHAKLLDFGLSRVQTKHARPLGGTLQWKAPEVILRNQRIPAPSADVFSFGLLAYFAVTGLKPFPGLAYKAIKHLRKRDRNMPKVWPRGVELIEECKALCTKCVKPDASARPSMAHLQVSILAWRPLPGTKPGESVPVEPEGKPGWEKQVKQLRQLLSEQEVQPSEIETGEIPAQPSTDQQQRKLYPAFEETPEASKRLILKAVLAQWNIPVPDDCCCDFHAGINAGLSVLQELQMECCSCDSPWADSQCPRCGLMDTCDGISECTMCRLLASADPQYSDNGHQDPPEPAEVQPFMSL